MILRLVFPLVVFLAAASLAVPGVAQEPASGPSRAELDSRFEQLMSGVRLDGKFSVILPTGESPPSEDLYMVSELSRGEGATWVFTAKMSYGDQMEMAVPIPVEVQWAGDTPVLTMTNQTIEGMGTFTVRLLIYEGRYAGTWQHGPVGGHMWGRLVKAEAAAPAEKPGEEPGEEQGEEDAAAPPA